LAGASWSGFEIQADAHPEWAGAELLRLLRVHGLVESCRRTTAARLFNNMHLRASPATHSMRGDLAWAYMIDPATRELRVYHEGAVASVDAPALLGTWGRVAVHTIHPDGSCTPPEMTVKLPEPWPLLRVDATWDPAEGLSLGAERAQRDSDAEATARLATRRRIVRDCVATSLDVDDFYSRVEQLLTERFLREPWGERSPGHVYIERQWTSGSKYWSLALDGTTLMYPPAGWGRAETGIPNPDVEGIVLFVEPDRKLELDVHRDRLVVDPIVRSILRTAIHAVPWVFAMLDLVRARQVPDPRGEELERLAQSPRDASDWQVFEHPDGRIWSIRASAKGYQLRLGDPADDPLFKERAGKAADMTELIDAQLSDGFVRSAGS
jgi:hypothetical protein